MATWAAPRAGHCTLERAVGLPCPGCGLGGGVLAAAEGRVGEALRSYPPLATLAALYLLGVVWLVLRLRGLVPPESLRRGAAWLGGATAALVTVNWVISVATS